MRLLRDIAVGLVTQTPQGGIDRRDVEDVQWLQRAIGRVLLRWLPFMFSGSVLSQFIKLFIY